MQNPPNTTDPAGKADAPRDDSQPVPRAEPPAPLPTRTGADGELANPPVAGQPEGMPQPPNVSQAEWAQFQQFRAAQLARGGDPFALAPVPTIGGTVAPETGQIVPDPSPTAVAQGVAAPRRFTGQPTTRTIRVESDRPNAAGKTATGIDAHEFVIEDNGFGHYRVANGPADAPWFDSEDGVRDWLTSEHVSGGNIQEA